MTADERRDYMCEYMKRRREKLLAVNKCTDCGKPNNNPSYKLCDECRTKHRNVMAEWANNGLCRTCGMTIDRKPYKNCSFCRQRKRLWYQKCKEIRNGDNP